MTDLETTELDTITLMGGWRLLCLATLYQNVRSLIENRQRQNPWRFSKTDNYQSEAYLIEDERWLGGGTGAITFEDCCECLEVTPDVARERIKNYVKNNHRKKLDELFQW